MLKKLTWKDLLNFPCDTVYIQESPSSTSFNRLVLATNWDIVKEKYK